MSNSSSFFYSKAGVVIPMCTGIVSALSSLTIMTVIYRSQVKFASIYNRIMFGFSFFDFIGSVSLALTLLPLPADQPYPFLDWARGNTSTCEAQGFMILLGTGAAAIYLCGLCTFYACLLFFQMPDNQMRRFVEPGIHISSWIVPLIGCIIALKAELFNPTPFEPWCTTIVYPFECAFNEEVQCIRGDREFAPAFYLTTVITGLISISFLVLSLTTIIIGTCKGRRVRSLFHQTEMPNDDLWRKKQRLLIMQAVMYFFAFLITWIFVVVQGFNLINDAQLDTSMNAINVLYRIFYPLQGFFNAIIFFHHKVTNLRQCHDSISLCKALYYIILHPKMKMPEMHLSGLAIVELDRRKQEENKNKIKEQKQQQQQQQQQQQAGNPPDHDNNNNDSKNTSSPDADDRKNDRISFSEEISYMFDDAGVWVYTDNIEENENDENMTREVCEDEENLYDTLSQTNLSHDMSFMNASFLAVSHVSELSSIKSKDKEQSDRNELSLRRVSESISMINAVEDMNCVSSQGMKEEDTDDAVANCNPSDILDD